MTDYSIDSNFDLHFNDVNDFVTVDGRREFEQDLVVRLHFDLADLLGTDLRSTNTEKKINLLATRVAKEYDQLDKLEDVSANRSVDQPNTLDVQITYSSGEIFEESINAS